MINGKEEEKRDNTEKDQNLKNKEKRETQKENQEGNITKTEISKDVLQKETTDLSSLSILLKKGNKTKRDKRVILIAQALWKSENSKRKRERNWKKKDLL